MAEATTPADTAAAEWLRAAARGFFESIYEAEVASARGMDHMEVKAAADKLANAVVDKLWTRVDHTFNDLVKLIPDFPFDLAAWLLTQAFGLSFQGADMRTVFGANPTATERQAYGRVVKTLYDETLKTEDVAQGFKNRTPGDAEWVNFQQLTGAALRLQLGGIVLEWIGKKIPGGLGDVFEEISDVMNSAIALDDALEEVVQVPMQAVIQRGLEALYNRKLKPADLSATEAFHARIADRIDETTLTKILDNAGYRDDIRQILRDFAASNLTESDINDLYQWGLFSREQVKEQYKNKFFEEPERELKTKLVELTRRQKLREKVYELYGNLYRDGVATREEIKPFLDNYGLKPDEQEMWFQIQELERRQRKWISDANILKLVMAKAVTYEEAYNYWVLQGMEPGDAARLLSLAVQEEQEAQVKALEREAKAAIAKLPKAIRDKCDDLLKPEDILSEVLARLIGLIPGDLNVIPGAAKLKSYIECALKAILNP